MDDIISGILTMELQEESLFSRELQEESLFSDNPAVVTSIEADPELTLLDNELATYEASTQPAWQDFDLPIEEFQVLPLEVVNYFCRTHFDDEDFIYCRFDLPPAIQQLIANSGARDINQFMHMDLQDAQHEGLLTPDALAVYEFVIGIYDIVQDYMMTLDAEQVPDSTLWPSSYMQDVLSVCNILFGTCNFNMYDPMYKGLMPYYREIYYGLGLIITQLDLITKYYLKRNVHSPALFNYRHQDRYMRLVNNLCIIMIHNRFTWRDYVLAVPEEEPAISSSMITERYYHEPVNMTPEMPDIQPAWKLGHP